LCRVKIAADVIDLVKREKMKNLKGGVVLLTREQIAYKTACEKLDPAHPLYDRNYHKAFGTPGGAKELAEMILREHGIRPRRQ